MYGLSFVYIQLIGYDALKRRSLYRSELIRLESKYIVELKMSSSELMFRNFLIRLVYYLQDI